MPKVKVKRKSTWVDMTAMCDVAFLLLTFFMLTSNFTAKEPVIVSTPASISEIKIPETNVMKIIVDKNGRIFFGVDGQENRISLLRNIGKHYNINFTPLEEKQFSVVSSFGVPVENLKSYLALSSSDRDNDKNALGIPVDSTNNQFRNWVVCARDANKELRIAIKADSDTPYPKIKSVISTLTDINENRFNLITKLEEAPKDL